MPELRKDIITDRWVIIATERAARPQEYISPPDETDQSGCPFCPGQEHQTPPELWAARNGSQPNQPGWKVRVVPNKFPALRIEGELSRDGEGIYDLMNGVGAHEVIIESPEHHCALEDQSVEDITVTLTAGKERMLDLLFDDRFRYILLFKNVGRSAGASLSHSHCQLIATPVTPLRIKEKLVGSREYFERKERSVFHDILRQEQRDGRRVVFENSAFLVFCPFAARFPYELCIMPKRQAADFHSADADELRCLADALKEGLSRLNRALGRPKYNLILHTAPARGRHLRRDYWGTIDLDFRWHLEILPRLTLTAGFEWGTGFFINPVAPETAAAELRNGTP